MTSERPAREHGALLSKRRLPANGGRAEKIIAVHVADCERLRSQASSLVNRMYGWRGYGTGHQLAGGDNQTTFVASADGQIIGTLTLTVDGPSGLSTDQTFGKALDAFRQAPGAQLCELTKFAVDPATRSPEALAALFHVIFIYGMQRHECTDLFIEVHPRHVRYYEAMLGFERIGSPKIDASVSWWPADTPVQLMRLEVSEIARQITHHAGQAAGDGRSLYPHFFSQEEEEGIAARVVQLGDGVGHGRKTRGDKQRHAHDFWRETVRQTPSARRPLGPSPDWQRPQLTELKAR